MRVLIYGINFSPELTGVGKFTGELAEWLHERGHQVRVVTAPPYYPAWKVAAGYKGWRYSRETVHGIEVYRCPLWVPGSPNGMERVLHLLSFAVSSIPVMLWQIFWRPNVVFVVEPSLFCSPAALLTARLANAKAWLHIQDYEVEAYFGLGFSSGGFIKKCATAVEGWLMRRFDRVSSVSKQMVARLAVFEVPRNRTSLFPNWVDTDLVRPKANGRGFRDEWGLSGDRRIVLYAGSMGNKQGLEMVLEIAASLQRDHPEIVFLLVGEGSAKALLVELARNLGLQNVMFQPPQPPDDLPALLSLADVHLVVQKRGAAEAVMPSKLAGILAAGGTAIVTADEDTDLGRLVVENPGIAILVPPEDRARFRAALLAALADKGETAGINLVAREYAERHLATDVVLTQFEGMLSETC